MLKKSFWLVLFVVALGSVLWYRWGVDDVVVGEYSFGSQKVLEPVSVEQNSENDLMEEEAVSPALSESELPEKEKGAEILFGGDVMLDRYMRVLARRGGVENFLDDVEEIFAARDATVLNFEGVVNKRKSVSEGKPQSDPRHFRFTFDPETVEKFIRQISSPLIIADGNNHSLDFGFAGFEESRAWYIKKNLDFFGDIRRGDKPATNRVLRKTLGGREISFVGYNEFLGNPLEETLKLVRLEAQAGRDVVVYTHWGTEYLRSLPAREQIKARKFIDAGARLVVGVHPHVIQPMEVYRKGLIFYSLGNFVFDQFFSRDVRERLAVACELSRDGVECDLIFLGQSPEKGLEFLPAERVEELRKELAQNSLLSPEQRRQIIEEGKVKVSKF